MFKVPGYSDLSLLHEQPHVLIYRAFSEKTNSLVLLKVLRSEYPTPEELARYENEFNLLKEDLGPSVPSAFEMLQIDKMRVMVLADIGGHSLNEEMSTRQLSLTDKIDLAVSIVKALAEIQEHGIIHRDIKPANIVLNPRSGQLQIIDFGLAAKAKEIPTDSLKSYVGTLQYMSPEQTGRTQIPIDYRSDYYSLGVTLYHLFAGQMPYNAHDEMEWVHAHIALAETPLHKLNKSIPLPVAMIVQKLMKKSSAERYQSCLGILKDLNTCRDLPDHGLGMKDFIAGQQDLSAEFRLSPKLYGREAEVALVTKILNNTVLGGKRMILVGGEPGVGKTSVCNVIRDGAVAANGYFVFGKYDQFRKDVPFSALISSFNQLIDQILTEDEAQIAAWRSRLQTALGANAAVVTEVVPKLELIIGKAAAIHELEGTELRVRFQNTFHAFIGACCQLGRPLVIFLDDLQWADAASRALILTFLSNTEADSLLVIGAYRDEHVDAAHPLTQMFRSLEEAKVIIDRIFLKGLSTDDILRLISDSFTVPQSNCEELAQVVFEKTGGNPFFVSQFLKALFEKELLKFSASVGWTWNVKEIRSQDVTSNVLTLLTEKIQGLPNATRDLLMIAACFGNYFRLVELKTHNEVTDEQNLATLQPAIRAGLVIEVKSGEYKFIHDRVQEASYRMLPAEEREAIHWRIAKNLLATWSEEQIRAGIFYLVNHWNAGSALIVNPSERERSAELNLIAASAAKTSSVYDAALHHATMGLELLRSENWTKYEHFLRPLMVIQAESHFAQSNFAEAERIFGVLLENVTDRVRKARIYRTLVDLTNMQSKNKESIRWGQKGLAQLGYHLPDKPNPLNLLYLMIKARLGLKKVIRSGVKEALAPERPEVRETMALFSSIAAPTYQENKNQLVWSSMTGILISLKEHFVEINGRSFLTCVLWQRFHQFEEAKVYAERLIRLYDPESIPLLSPNDFRGCYTTGGFSAHVTHSCKEALRILQLGKEYLAQNGDLMYSTICAHYVCVISAYTSPKLSKAEQIVDENLQFAVKQQYLLMRDSLRCKFIWTQALQGKIENPWDFEAFFKSMHNKELPLPPAWFRVKAQSYHFIMGDRKAAFELVNHVREARTVLPFAITTNVSRMLNVILILENIDSYAGRARRKVLREVRKELQFLKKLSDCNQLNHLPMYLMALSAWHKYRGHREQAVQCLQKAIESAKQAEVIMLEALANEMLAREFSEQGLNMVAVLYLREALYIYENWGASAKVEQLLRDNPDLKTKTIARSKGTSTSHANHITLDINTVLKASNALVAEVDMGRLVHKLLSILIENAGAERGVLVLAEDGHLFIKGELRVNSNQEFQLTHTPVTQFQDIARSIVAYVARTQESMVLESAIRDDRTSRDEYVKRAQVMSTVCIPILAGGDLKGMVYLENNASAAVFSADRVELMQTLAGQISISLENARMYEKQGEAIRMQNELATAHAVQEMLFPTSDFENENVHIAGYYRPASECGGDWWYYSKVGDSVYIWVGDATGHGAPAALVTSSTCSAVSILENSPDLTPDKAMNFLNKAVCRTTKGKINMTFFVGALNEKTGEFRFARASHDIPYLIRHEKVKNGAPSFSDFRNMLEPLQGVNGRRLGESVDETFESQSIMLEPGDTILFYTDGLPDVVNKDHRSWGERGFLQAFHEGISEGISPAEVTQRIINKADEFKKDTELADDITVCVLRFKGRQTSGQKKAA